MLYRKLGQTDEMISILGFGCMRLPIIGGDPGKIDEKRATEMIRYAIDNGVNYIDTAYPYHKGMSEPFLGKALKDGYREKIYLATKMPSWLINDREDMDYYLDEQLRRLQTDHIDLYLIHTLNRDYWPHLKDLGLLEFLDSAIEQGKIKYAGFSFHDEVDVFREIVDSYPWTFCQIQYNLVDEDYQAGKEGLLYAAEKDIGILIMEPLRGGTLATDVPEDIQQVWDKSEVKRSPAQWGLRYIWDYPQITAVLSGMSEMEHVVQNLEAAEEGVPNSLTENEKEIIAEVRDIYKSRIKVDCTGCRYCMPCPSGVNIHQNFKHLNNASIFNDVEKARYNYNTYVPADKKASNCTQCGQCEEKCPQHIPIQKMLGEVVQLLEY